MDININRELAIGNTFGATALGSFGGFWISLAIVLTPGGFQIVEQYPTAEEFGHAFSFFLYVGLNSISISYFKLLILISGMVYLYLSLMDSNSPIDLDIFCALFQRWMDIFDARPFIFIQCCWSPPRRIPKGRRHVRITSSVSRLVCHVCRSCGRLEQVRSLFN